MKRWIALLLALVMALGLTACGNQPAGDDGDADGSDDSVAITETDGRALYEAAIQLARDGDLSGGIEGLKKAVAAEETDTWTGLDIDLAYKRMAQLYRLLGDTEGQAQANADCLAARGWEPLGLDDLYFEGNCDLDEYFDASPFGNWGNNVLIYNLRDGDEFTLDETFPEKAEEMGFDAFFQWADECMRTNLYALVSAASFDSVTLDSYKQTHSKSISFESPFVTFSACGVMTGMTREQVYAQLQMTPWCQVLVDHSFAKFVWDPDARWLSVDTREYTDGDIVLSERGTMCTLELKFENDVLTWMQYRE
ncbi:MAG: hypothetical protein BHW35_05150 [Firmicutes bacterium CAG:176_63_11]|nr:MAG: hypothetical protein BHW35_05150 [Firmicutes bacterium CAG:176_63_11]